MSCSCCNEEREIIYDDVAIHFLSGVHYAHNNGGTYEKIPLPVCRECADELDEGHVSYCPECEDGHSLHIIPDDVPYSRLKMCPEHSDLELACAECGATAATRTLRLNSRGVVYCNDCALTAVKCYNYQCHNMVVPDSRLHTKSWTEWGLGHTCPDCPPIRKPDWWRDTKYGKFGEWEHRDGCKCRGCYPFTAAAAAVVGADPDEVFPEDRDEDHAEHIYCYCCDYLIHVDTATQDSSGHPYCHFCAKFLLMVCTECNGHYTDNQQPQILGNICMECLANSGQYYRCEATCKEWAPTGVPCSCGGIYPYNYVPIFKFLLSPNEDRSTAREIPFMGFELEVEAQSPGTNRVSGAMLTRSVIGTDWSYIQHDGSLLERGMRGFEIVSHPFTYSWFNEQWPLIETLLLKLSAAGYRSWEGGRCGMHIHISRGPMAEAHQLKFLNFIYGSSNLALCVGQRGVRSRGITEYAPFDKEARHLFIRKVRNYQNPGADGHRAAVNTLKPHTLEGRWFRGTLNPEGFRKNIEFMHSVWYFTRNLGHVTANEFNYIKWLQTAPQTKKYPSINAFIKRTYIGNR